MSKQDCKKNSNSLDNLINYLLTFNNQHKQIIKDKPDIGHLPFRFNISINIIESLCNKVKKIFKNENNLLNLSAPLYLFGDIHGQYSDLIRFLELTDTPPKVKMLFLGDYVDRGDNSIEVIVLLFCLKIKYPKHIHLIRGNHECSKLNESYGFLDECIERYGKQNGKSVWNSINKVLHQLPISVLINNKIFCTHGGISPSLHNLKDINSLEKGINIPDDGIFCDLTWSDPKKHKQDWKRNDRGVSYTFNENAVDTFMDKHNLQLICRAHQVVNNGYKFFNNKKLITIFSAPNYCGEVGNNGAVMKIDENFECSFIILKPVRKPYKKYKSLSVSSQND